jgi:hypothetical protein
MNRWVPGLLIFGAIIMVATLAFTTLILATTSSFDPCTGAALACSAVGFVAGVLMVARGVCLAIRDPEQKTPAEPKRNGGSRKKSGDDLLSRCTHYHRPRLLNGRVRNGNGCDQPGMLTGKFKWC